MSVRWMVSGQDLWRWRSQALVSARSEGIDHGEVDWLLLELTQLDRLALRLGSFRELDQVGIKVSLAELEALWQRRLTERVPVQYLVGFTPWRQFHLQVSEAVLIPRPETEYLIDLALKGAPEGGKAGHWVDVGTGSGAIALGLADAFPQATIHAVDLSQAALEIARANAERLSLGDRIQFYSGSWLEPLTHLQGQLCAIVSNPPYIPSDLVPDLQPEVAQHEPHLALDGGADGLTAFRVLVAAGTDYLQSGGLWLVESMAGQPEQIVELLQQQDSYHDIQVHADLAGIERFVMAYRN